MEEPRKPPISVELGMPAGTTESQAMATLQIEPIFRNAHLASMAASGVLSATSTKAEFSDTLGALDRSVTAGKKGDLSQVSAALSAQVVSLVAIYTDLARRGFMNLGSHPDAAMKLMGLALKAQGNARVTAEALARMHQPREQTVIHKHINVGPNGQAIVADEFHHHSRGLPNAGYADQPHTLGAPGAALLGQDPLGQAVPGAGDPRKEALPHARAEIRRVQAPAPVVAGVRLSGKRLAQRSDRLGRAFKVLYPYAGGRIMKTLVVYVGLAVLLLVGWIAWAAFGIDHTYWWSAGRGDKAIERAGQWSDSFGAFNALVSALGFAAVLATLWLQSASLKDQAKDQHKQRFENTFFELLRIMRELRSELSFQHSEEYLHSISASRYAAYSLRRGGDGTVSTDRGPRLGAAAIAAAIAEIKYWALPSQRGTGRSQKLSAIYNSRVNKNNEATFSPYFRIVYTILNRIREDKILSQSDKDAFGNLLRSQLNSDEILLLGINAMTPYAKDLDQLLTQFRMLKYLPKSALRLELEDHFEAMAFEART